MEANASPEMQRRKTDGENAAAEITGLIKAEESPKDRAVLLVLQTINNALISSNELLIAANKAVGDVDQNLSKHIGAFNEHVIAEGKLFSEGRGMYRVITWLVGALQLLSVAVGGVVWAEVKGSADQLVKFDTKIQILELQVKDLKASVLVLSAAPLQTKMAQPDAKP